MKRFTSFLVCTILSLSSLGVSCNEVLANKEVSVGVIFNDKKLNLTLPILNQNDRTFYPFREILESMGATVSWNTDTKTATGTLNGNTVEFIINSNIYKVNGTLNNLDSGTYPFIYNDRTYIPIRFAAEALKYTVDWDSYTNTIEINAPENTMETPVEIPAETPVETLTEIPVDSNAYVSLNGIKIAIGDSQSTVESLLGKADRVDPSIYDFSWHVYNSDYSNFIMVGIGDGEVKGLYTNVKGFETGYGNYGETGKKNTYESAIFYFDKYENNKIYAVSFVPTSPTVTITNAVLKAQELENIDAVNAFRTNYGVPTLKYDEIATITARNHSQDMADHNYFSHTDLNGLEPWDRFTNSGGTYSSVGENISAGDWSGIEAFDAWLNSSTHRDNMLSTDFTYIGVGLSYNPSSEYWYYMTQLFFAK